MPQYRTPGVYVHEVDMRDPAAISISPSITGFVGIAPRGKVGEPVLATSWSDYINKFAHGLNSPFLDDAYLSYSVFGFFNNGGTMAYIVKVTDGDEEKASVTLDDGQTESEDIITIEALDPGEWGNDLKVKFTENEDEASNYDLTVKMYDEEVEVFENLSFDSSDSRFAENIVNGASRFISVDVDKDESLQSSDEDTDKPLSGGVDGDNVEDNDLINAFEKFDELESLGILVCPESQSENVNTQGVNYCKVTRKNDAVFFADAEENASLEDVKNLSKAIGSDYRGLYYPWIEVNDPIATTTPPRKMIPVAGHVAGVASRIDFNRSVYKAPAGTEALVRGAIQLKRKILDSEQGDLNKAGVNVIRNFTNFGNVVWGARTMPEKDRADGLIYLNQRRGLNYIKNWIDINTQWAVFEPNNTILWRKLTLFCKSFLLGEYEKGGFKGETAAEAFFVKCDKELNPPDTVKEGKVFIEIGVAIAEPAEFVIFRVGQWDGGSSVEEV